MRLIELFWKDSRGTMVSDIAKAGAAIAFLSVVAANFVSNRTADLDKDRLTQVASAASQGRSLDPLVTGSIRASADATRLDPCVIRR